MRLVVLAIVAFFGWAALASAQSPVAVQFGPSTPSVELGVHADALGAMGGWHAIGGRVAKRHQNWLVTEWAYDKKSFDEDRRDARILIASVRLQDPHPPAGRRAFVTAGLAAAHEWSFSWSPVLSGGMQHEAPGSIVALRLEVQYFLRGRSTSPGDDRARLLFGLALGIP